MPASDAPILSVVLCTWNRASGLDRTLATLARCPAPAAGAWELVLVDNACTDATPEVAARHAAHLPLRRVLEPVQGLAAARNRGLSVARAPLIVFTDDDVDVDGGWLGAFVEAAAAHPEAAWFGGRILPSFDGPPPRWLRDPSMALLAGLLGHYDLGATARPYGPDDPLPFGACFGLRRSAADALGTFRTDLGVIGAEPGRGEETEYLTRARERGLRGLYVGTALVHHRIPRDRFRAGALREWGRQVGRSQARRGTRRPGTRRAEWGFLLRGLWQRARGRGDRYRQCLVNAGIQRGRREWWGPAGEGGDAVG